MLDYLITNGRLLDPETGKDFIGSLGITGDKITALYPPGARMPESSGLVDARGGLVMPGIIDVHTHTDNDTLCAERLLAQGVTTVLSGNCGISPLHIKTFFNEQEKKGFPVHQAEQIGHTALREAAGLTDVYAAPRDGQIKRMKELARRAFEEGAYGLSFGLEYVPGASNREVVELAKTAGEAGRLVSIHTRLSKPGDSFAMEEALALPGLTGARVIISHLVYMYVGDELPRTIGLIREARRRGTDVWVDSGMYTTFASYAGTALFEEERFHDGDLSFEKLIAASGTYAGQRMDYNKYRDIRQNSPQDIFLYELGADDDLYRAYSLEDVLVSTDAGPAPPGQGHPQNAATYPRFFRVMVRERAQLSLLEGVRRCTLLPAQALGLTHKGRLKAGADADITVLDLERLREKADFPGIGIPDAVPEGVVHVFVAGKPAVLDEKRQDTVMAGLPLYPVTYLSKVRETAV
jgi:N-acyl-D-amino-acid deacylase